MTPPIEPPPLPAIPSDMVRFGDYGAIVPNVGSPTVMGGIDAFGGGAVTLAGIGDMGGVPINPLYQSSPPVNGMGDIGMDLTQPDLGGLIPGVMQLVGLGMPAPDTLVMPRTQLDALLAQMGPREVVVADPDATGQVDMSALPEELPLAARMSPARVYAGAAAILPAEIADVVSTAESLMHETGTTMREGESGPPLPPALWYSTLRIAGRDALGTPFAIRNDFAQLTVDATILTDPRTPGNLLELSASVRDILLQLRSETLSAPARQRLETQLSTHVAALREGTAIVNRWRSYYIDRASVEHTMDSALSSFAGPFGQDFVRFNLETRVAQGRRSGESWEDAVVRITGGSEMFPNSPFPSRVTSVADFVSPPDGSDMADPWAPNLQGIRLEVSGDPAEFARSVVDLVNSGGQNVLVGPVYTRELLEAVYHGPEGDRMVPAEAFTEDVAPSAILHSWETSHARLDPANPNRVIVTQSVSVRGADGEALLDGAGAPVTREVTFFVEVNGS